MVPLTLQLIDFLQTTEAQAALDELAGQDVGDQAELDLLMRLRRTRPPEQAAALLDQARLRRKAADKFPHPERLLFTDDALQQASSRAVAASPFTVHWSPTWAAASARTPSRWPRPGCTCWPWSATRCGRALPRRTWRRWGSPGRCESSALTGSPSPQPSPQGRGSRKVRPLSPRKMVGMRSDPLSPRKMVGVRSDPLSPRKMVGMRSDPLSPQTPSPHGRWLG